MRLLDTGPSALSSARLKRLATVHLLRIRRDFADSMSRNPRVSAPTLAAPKSSGKAPGMAANLGFPPTPPRSSPDSMPVSDSRPEATSALAVTATPSTAAPAGTATATLPSITIATFSYFPAVPTNILRLKPDIFQRLCCSVLPPTGIEIPCSPLTFQILSSNRPWLHHKDASILWEYNGDMQKFIIKCMPTPVHEAFSIHATDLINNTIRAQTGFTPYQVEIGVASNTTMSRQTPKSRPSKVIPDLAIQVRLHPEEPVETRRGVIVEVAFTQTLASLQRRAKEFLLPHDEVHMVILLHVYEEKTQAAEENAAASMTELFTGCFEGRSFEEVFLGFLNDENIAIGGGLAGNSALISEETARHILNDKMQPQMLDYLRELDNAGSLFPPLLKPLGARIYVYRQKVPSPELTEIERSQPKPQLPVQRIGKRRKKRFADKLELDDEQDENKPEEQDGNNTEEQDDAVKGREKATAGGQHYPVDVEGNFCEEIECIYTSKFLERNTYIAPSTTSTFASTTPHEFSITLAGLFSPLALSSSLAIPPAVLNIMPPLLRPHAHKKITFDLQTCAIILTGAVVLHNTKKLRVADRATGIIVGLWEPWNEARVCAERVALKKANTTERDNRLPERERKRESTRQEERSHQGGRAKKVRTEKLLS